jgi:hypothetical protein
MIAMFDPDYYSKIKILGILKEYIFSDKHVTIIFIGYFLFIFVAEIIILIINLICILKDYENNNTKVTFKKMMRIKIFLIPYWIIIIIFFVLSKPEQLNFISSFLFFISSKIFTMNLVFFIYTSIFSIAYLRNLQKNSIVTGEDFKKHTILQLIFIIDIIDTVYIIRKWNKPNVA